MKKTILVIFILAFASCSSDDSQYGERKSFSIRSDTNGTNYHIDVILPPGYSSAKTYPSLYLLDPNWHLDTVDSILADLDEDNKIGDVIVIGIDYEDENKRAYDYSYPKATSDVGFSSGGGEKFHTFLRDELIPEVESKYSCDSSLRTIMGHSLGGYFPLYSLFAHYVQGTGMFSGYAAISASIWYENSYLLGLEQEARASTNSLQVSLFMAYGELEGPIMAAPFDALKNQIEASAYSGLRLQTKKYRKGHNSVMPPAFEDALRFFYGR